MNEITERSTEEEDEKYFNESNVTDARRFQSFRTFVGYPLPLVFPLPSLSAREEGEGAKVTIDTLIAIERAISREKPEVNVPLRSTPYTENKSIH
ncbi:hypothetical protein V1477_019850 [Vespula maculifrons]|uniref:Uncharacterized protein n=2 Tax=Vespula TaxID=7451 RepID=A0A834KE33_VESVU|nr:hypothetical protein HZH66_005391 [Vespula vulgaris]